MKRYKMKKTLLWITILFFITPLYYAQNYSKIIDSLKQVNLQAKITKNTKAKTLYNIAWYYFSSNSYDSSIIYAKQAYIYSKKNELDTVINKSTLILGALFSIKNEYDSSVYYLQSGISYFEEKKTNLYINELSKLYSLLANAYSEQKKYDKAYIYFNKSETIFIEKKDTTGLIFNKIAKGNLFNNLQLYDKALKEFNDAIHLSILSKNKTNISAAYNDIGTVYKKIGDYEKAKHFYIKGIEVKDNEIHTTGGLYNNLSLLYDELNNYDSAFYYNDLAISIFKKHNIQFKEIQVLLNKFDFILKQGKLDSLEKYLNNIPVIPDQLKSHYFLLQSKLSFKQNNTKKAVDFAQKSLYFSQQNKDVVAQKNAHELLYEIYLYTKNFKEALVAVQQFTLFKDSIFNQEKSLAVQKIIVENIIESKDSEIELLKMKNENEQAEKDRLLWIALSLIIGLFSISLITFLTAKNRKQKIKISLKEKELLKIESEKNKLEFETKLSKSESEKAKSELEIELLKKETEEIKKEILDFSFESQKNKEFIALINKELKNISKSYFIENSELKNLVMLSNQFFTNEIERNKFQEKIDSIQKSFFEKLNSEIKLTKTEKKLATLLKLDFTSKEIASFLNVEEKSVEIYRSRLRKKLNIDSDLSFQEFLNRI